jgi:hypothetical protein
LYAILIIPTHATRHSNLIVVNIRWKVQIITPSPSMTCSPSFYCSSAFYPQQSALKHISPYVN